MLVARGKKVFGIRLGGVIFESPVVVNATGSWAGRNRQLGLRFPVVPVRGQIVVVRGGPLRVSSVLHAVGGNYIVPWEPKEYLLGTTVERKGFQSRVTSEGVRAILKNVQKLVPRIRKCRMVRSWAGLRPYSKDQLPFIGPTSVRGLYAATGFYKSGILIGCYVGELLAKGIVSGKWPRVLKPFDPRRQKSARLGGANGFREA